MGRVVAGRASLDATRLRTQPTTTSPRPYTQIPPRSSSLAGDFSAAVAIDLAARKQVAGLIVLGAFTNIPEQAHAMLPWVPKSVVRLFIRERFDNLSKIRRVTCPIFIGHGTDDELVPFVMAERLAEAARQHGPVTFLPIQGCSHNGIFEASKGCVWTAIRDFSSNLWQASIYTDESS